MEIFTNENLLLQMEICCKPCPAYDFISFPLRRDLDKKSAWDWGICLLRSTMGNAITWRRKEPWWTWRARLDVREAAEVQVDLS